MAEQYRPTPNFISIVDRLNHEVSSIEPDTEAMRAFGDFVALAHAEVKLADYQSNGLPTTATYMQTILAMQQQEVSIHQDHLMQRGTRTKEYKKQSFSLFDIHMNLGQAYKTAGYPALYALRKATSDFEATVLANLAVDLPKIPTDESITEEQARQELLENFFHAALFFYDQPKAPEIPGELIQPLAINDVLEEQEGWVLFGQIHSQQSPFLIEARSLMARDHAKVTQRRFTMPGYNDTYIAFRRTFDAGCISLQEQKDMQEPELEAVKILRPIFLPDDKSHLF